MQIAVPVLPGALFKNGLFQKKTNRGVEDILFSFLKKTLELLIFLLYLWKFQTKQSSTPGNSTKLCYGNSKARGGGHQVLWKFPMIFSWSLFWKFHPTLCLVSFCFFCLVVQLRPVVCIIISR